MIYNNINKKPNYDGNNTRITETQLCTTPTDW